MNFEQLYDVSVALSNDLATWPGDPPINIEKASDMTKGDAANVSRLIMGVHTGTHMDAPHHFVDEMGGVDSFSLQALVGTALVVELNIDHHIGAADLEAARLPEGTERVLFKTPNSAFWRDPTTFQKQFVAVAEDGAKW